MFTVYVLHSEKHNKIYIGYSSNLSERLVSHNVLGNSWTSRFRPWSVVLSESYATKEAALKREKSLKAGHGRKWIREFLIPK